MSKTKQNENHGLKQIKRRSMMREALERLGAAGCANDRTDLMGTVTLTIKN